jgi:membrane-associated PAP2 superfamily phosphatase
MFDVLPAHERSRWRWPHWIAIFAAPFLLNVVWQLVEPYFLAHPDLSGTVIRGLIWLVALLIFRDFVSYWISRRVNQHSPKKRG